ARIARHIGGQDRSEKALYRSFHSPYLRANYSTSAHHGTNIGGWGYPITPGRRMLLSSAGQLSLYMNNSVKFQSCRSTSRILQRKKPCASSLRLPGKQSRPRVRRAAEERLLRVRQGPVGTQPSF